MRKGYHNSFPGIHRFNLQNPVLQVRASCRKGPATSVEFFLIKTDDFKKGIIFLGLGKKQN
jgi:hypothetical protein